MNGEHIPEYDRIIAHDKDISDTRSDVQFHGFEVPAAVSEDIVRDAEAYLERHEVESGDQLDGLLEALDTAIAINNDPRARELRRTLAARYRREAMPE